jgi:hypothetical protein
MVLLCVAYALSCCSLLSVCLSVLSVFLSMLYAVCCIGYACLDVYCLLRFIVLLVLLSPHLR